jgi:hypothetical protein
MAAIYDDIRRVLETTLAGVTGIPAIAWENVSFSPTTGTPYVRARFAPTMREPAVRGLNPQMYYQGVFVVDVCVPEGVGPAVGDDLADTIIDAFDAPNDLTVNGISITIRYAERELGTIEGAYYTIPVNIGWLIYN